MGRSIAGFDSADLHELIHARYRIVYEIDERTITIISILHTAADAEARLRDLLGDD